VQTLIDLKDQIMKSKTHRYIAYFDCLGFECIVDIDSAEHRQLLETIQGVSSTPAFNLHAMILRARFNPQRSPEIWVFESDANEQQLCALAESDPQQMANLIRSNGRAVFVTTPQERKIL
jgi:hypothetical protein